MANCSQETPATIYASVPETFQDSMEFSATVAFKENITGDLDLVVVGSRCSLDMKTCDVQKVFNFKNICQTFKEKNALFAKEIALVSPPLACPLLARNYTFPLTAIDLKFAKMFPIEGKMIVGNFKLIAIEKVSKKKKVIFCMHQEFKVTNVRKN